ncbi:alanine racemase, partial [bacterium]|nr:alanine racemase [bacterium]
MKRQIAGNLYRPTRADIDLSAIEYNFRQVRKIVKNKTKILVVLKADAYGHGAIRVAKKLKSCGVEYFGVATILEAIELRRNKIDTPILLLAVLSSSEFPVLIRYKIIPTIADLETAICLNRELNRFGKKIPIHIKIDTGMGRIGVWHKDSMGFVKNLSKLKNL